jgi:hypothetical protein
MKRSMAPESTEIPTTVGGGCDLQFPKAGGDFFDLAPQMLSCIFITWLLINCSMPSGIFAGTRFYKGVPFPFSIG